MTLKYHRFGMCGMTVRLRHWKRLAISNTHTHTLNQKRGIVACLVPLLTASGQAIANLTIRYDDLSHCLGKTFKGSTWTDGEVSHTNYWNRVRIFRTQRTCAFGCRHCRFRMKDASYQNTKRSGEHCMKKHQLRV
jgi:hypothetical protein